MFEESLKTLSSILDKAPGLLMEIGEANMSIKPAPEKWSKKEILGHLIDSATNNHQRFVRGQFEIEPEITYNQNKWNEFNYYQKIHSSQIISFWTSYNMQILELGKLIPTSNLKMLVKTGDVSMSIELLFIDYVDHLEHHLKQIINY